MNDNQKMFGALENISKGAIAIFIGKTVFAITSYIYLIMCARILGPFWMGVYILGMSFVLLLAIVGRMGFQISLVRFVSIYSREKSEHKLKGVLGFSFFVSFITSTIIATGLFFLSDFLSSSVFHNPELALPLKAFSLGIPLYTVLYLFLAVFLGLGDMKNKAVIDAMQPLSVCVLFLVLIFFVESKIWAAIFAYLISLIISVAIGMLNLARKLPFLFDTNIKAHIEQKTILMYTLPLSLGAVTSILFQRTDTVILGFFRPATDVGIYGLAASIAFGITFFLYVFNQVFAPIIAGYYNSKRIKELEYLFKTITRWVFMLTFPLFLFILLLRSEIMLFLGKAYVQGAPVLLVLALAQLFNISVGSVTYMLSMTAHPRIFLINSVIGNAVNIILNIILIPRFGIMGAAFATGLAIITWNSLNLAFVYKKIHIHPLSLFIYKPLVSGIMAYCIVWGIYQFVALDCIAKLLIGLLLFPIYLGLEFLMKLEKEDIFVLTRIIKRRL